MKLKFKESLKKLICHFKKFIAIIFYVEPSKIIRENRSTIFHFANIQFVTHPYLCTANKKKKR